jgi:hypothetical protein
MPAAIACGVDPGIDLVAQSGSSSFTVLGLQRCEMFFEMNG